MLTIHFENKLNDFSTLIVEYGTFYELVRSAYRWQFPMVLDPADPHKNPLTRPMPVKYEILPRRPDPD